MIARIVAAMLCGAVLMGVPSGAGAADDRVVVFAAASLRGPLDEALALWDGEAVVSYAASSALARQIESGAPANLFISANTLWMDALEDGGAVLPSSRHALFTNRLVLVGAAQDATTPAKTLSAADFTALPRGSRIAMALVDAVPAGIYGREALTSLGVWDQIAPQVVQTDNVRSALAMVSRGEVAYGIVYATDVALTDAVDIEGDFDSSSHSPIVYPLAIVTGGDTPATRDLASFLQSAAVLGVFEAAGFSRPPRVP